MFAGSESTSLPLRLSGCATQQLKFCLLFAVPFLERNVVLNTEDNFGKLPQYLGRPYDPSRADRI